MYVENFNDSKNEQFALRIVVLHNLDQQINSKKKKLTLFIDN